ncbi:hypothetical protein PENTCL1PPCAC_19915, partial [Pristionchus entomophagus]
AASTADTISPISMWRNPTEKRTRVSMSKTPRRVFPRRDKAKKTDQVPQSAPLKKGGSLKSKIEEKLEEEDATQKVDS